MNSEHTIAFLLLGGLIGLCLRILKAPQQEEQQKGGKPTSKATVEKPTIASQELINCLRDSIFGYTAAEAKEAASKVSPDLPIEEQIRLALKFRGKGT